MNKRTKTALRRWCLYGWTFAKWTMAASAIGVVCGLIGTMFHFGVHEVTAFRGTHPWVLYLLPLAGFVIVSFYKLTETDGLGTDDIIDAVQAAAYLAAAGHLFRYGPDPPVRRQRGTGGRSPSDGRHHRSVYGPHLPAG